MKQNKYLHIETDSGEYSTKIIAIEVGSRGYASKDNEKGLGVCTAFANQKFHSKDFEIV